LLANRHSMLIEYRLSARDGDQLMKVAVVGAAVKLRPVTQER
jgi:hypothetical protein